MRGQFLNVWAEMARGVWRPIELLQDQLTEGHAKLLSNLVLPEDYEGHADLYVGLFREAYGSLAAKFRSTQYGTRPNDIVRRGIDLAEVTGRPELAQEEFLNLQAQQFASEADLVKFLERAYDVFGEYEDILAQRYKVLLQAFVMKFSLNYEVIDPCQIYPTLPGAFASLICELDRVCVDNPALNNAVSDFRQSFRDIKREPSDSRIRICIQKLFLLVEAISIQHQDVKAGTLGKAVTQLKTWPHTTIRESLSKLYGFASSYPGIRHAGNQESRLRELDTRDLIALCIVMAGYIPYIIDALDCENIYMSTRGPDDTSGFIVP